MARKLTRRDFLKAGVLGTGATVLAGCKFPARWINLEPYVVPPEEQIAGNATWYASACRMCPAGCGIIVRIMNGRALKIEGNPEHPLNQGKLCAVGQSGLQLLYHPDRLTGPVQQSKRGSRAFQAIDWNQAVQTLGSKLKAAGKGLAIIAGSGVGSSLYQLLATIAKAAGGPAPLVVDLHSIFTGYRAMTDSAQKVFGNTFVPVYTFDQADVVFSFGSDFLAVGPSPVYENIQFGNFRVRPKGMRGYLAVFEPRMSLTGAKADRWFPIKPGTEGMVAQAIAALIGSNGFGSSDISGRAKSFSSGIDVNAISQAADISVTDLTKMAKAFAEAAHPVAIAGSSLAGGSNAVDALSAVQALNVIAGNQPSSLGGPGSQSSPAQGLEIAYSNFSDLQNLINQMNSGSIQALLVVDANPLFDLPAKLNIQQALAKVPFIASLNPLVDETGAFSDLILPVRTYLEDWGAHAGVTGTGTPFVTGQQPVVEPLYGAFSAADVLLAVAPGIPNASSALPYSDNVAYLQNVVSKLPAGQDNLVNGVWERFLQHGGWWPTGAPSGAGTPATGAAVPPPTPLPAPTLQGSAQDYPFYLQLYQTSLIQNNKSAALPWLIGSPETLTSMSWRNWVEMNPATVKQLGLIDGDIVKVTTPAGEIEAPIFTYPAIRPDTIAIPVGYGHTDAGRFASGNGTNAIQLIGAQATADNSNLAWNTFRAKITPTGQHIWLPLFGDQVGTTSGFFNRENPAI